MSLSREIVHQSKFPWLFLKTHLRVRILSIIYSKRNIESLIIPNILMPRGKLRISLIIHVGFIWFLRKQDKTN